MSRGRHAATATNYADFVFGEFLRSWIVDVPVRRRFSRRLDDAARRMRLFSNRRKIAVLIREISADNLQLLWYRLT